jgi:hypothetical protein
MSFSHLAEEGSRHVLLGDANLLTSINVLAFVDSRFEQAPASSCAAKACLYLNWMLKLLMDAKH